MSSMLSGVVICSKFITFAVTKTTAPLALIHLKRLWFAQNSLPLRWQRQPSVWLLAPNVCCDLLKIHYLCGDKDNRMLCNMQWEVLWFAQNSLPLRWQRQHKVIINIFRTSCDLLKIHYLCGDKDNTDLPKESILCVVICSKFITFAVTKTTCGWTQAIKVLVVICSKFITFAVTKTTAENGMSRAGMLWFAQNSLPLRWQRQHRWAGACANIGCDLLKIHYLCGDKDNAHHFQYLFRRLWFAQNSLPLRWQRQRHYKV